MTSDMWVTLSYHSLAAKQLSREVVCLPAGLVHWWSKVVLPFWLWGLQCCDVGHAMSFCTLGRTWKNVFIMFVILKTLQMIKIFSDKLGLLIEAPGYCRTWCCKEPLGRQVKNHCKSYAGLWCTKSNTFFQKCQWCQLQWSASWLLNLVRPCATPALEQR